MLPPRLKLGVFLFVALTLALAGNMLLLQSRGQLPGAERAGGSPAGKNARVLSVSVADATAPAAASDAVAGEAKARPVAAPAKPAAEPAAKDGSAKDAAARSAAPAAAETLETVRAVQRELQARGYEAGSQDGTPGLVTRAAVLAYEYDHGLPLTAEPGERLLRQIKSKQTQLGAKPAAGQGERSPQAEQVIRTVQQSLVNANYAVGKIDGRLGEETVRAIREFEIDQSMPETGRVSGQLVARLARLAGQGRLAGTK